MTFINRLNSLLSEHHITRNKLATDLGLGSGTIATWEKRGTMPKAEHLTKIADYFGVTVDYLLGNAKNKEKIIVSCDEELNEHIALFKTNENYRIMFSLLKNAKEEEIEKAVKIVKAMLDEN